MACPKLDKGTCKISREKCGKKYEVKMQKHVSCLLFKKSVKVKGKAKKKVGKAAKKPAREKSKKPIKKRIVKKNMKRR